MKNATKRETAETINNLLMRYVEDPTKFGFNLKTKTCSYLTPEGNCCAVGFALKEEVRKELASNTAHQSFNVQLLPTKYLKYGIKEEFNHIDIKIWSKTQIIHDTMARKYHGNCGEYDFIENKVKYIIKRINNKSSKKGEEISLDDFPFLELAKEKFFS